MSKKKCKKCAIEKDLSEFYYRVKRKCYEARCKNCLRDEIKNRYAESDGKYKEVCFARTARYRAESRLFITEYLKTHSCVDCGESDLIVLQFDHKEGSDKKRAVSNLARYWHPNIVRAEIEKCDVRCANCHIRRTTKQFNWWKLSL